MITNLKHTIIENDCNHLNQDLIKGKKKGKEKKRETVKEQLDLAGVLNMLVSGKCSVNLNI